MPSYPQFTAAQPARPRTDPPRYKVAATTRTTYQMTAYVGSGATQLKSTYERCIETTLDWVKLHRLGLPEKAWRGDSFTLDLPGRKVVCQAIDSEGVWTLRMEHPDTSIPGRIWLSDIGLRRQQDIIRFGIRVICASPPTTTEEATLTTPRIVSTLSSSVGLRDVRSLDSRPWTIETRDELTSLYNLITDPSRSLPVVVLTEPDSDRLPVAVSRFVLNGDQIARSTIGLAHIVQLPLALTYLWTDMVSKPWSVFQGAVRTYLPQLNFAVDEPFEHPLSRWEQILFWQSNDKEGEDAFSEFLIDKLRKHSASRRIDWGDLLFISEAQAWHAAISRRDALDDRDWQRLYQEEIEALKAQVEEHRKETLSWITQYESVERELSFYKEQGRSQTAKIDSLLYQLKEKTGQDTDSSVDLPEDYQEAADWASQQLAGRLTLHPRAIRGLKDGQYEDLDLVCQALLLLANEYRNRCLGVEGANEAFEIKKQDLGLRYGKSIAAERAGEEGKTYFITYPPGSAQNRFLEWHLRKGSSKEPRLCLAIYFFWDADSQQVVVGWLPSHLENRQT